MKENWELSSNITIITKKIAEILLKPVFGDLKVLELELLHGGLSNANYKVTIRQQHQQKQAVLRIYSHTNRCLMERDVLNLVKSKIPVPECLFASDEKESEFPAYMVQSWVQGYSLKQFLQSSNATNLQKEKMAFLLGKNLALIHSFTFESHGFLGPDLQVVTPLEITPASYITYMEQFLNGHAGKRLDQRQRESLWKWIHNSIHLLHNVNPIPCLVHADFNSLNILITDKNNDITLTGILDWEFAAAGLNLFDLGNLFRYEHDLQNNPFVQEVIQSYLRHGGSLPEHCLILIRLIDLLNLCSMLNRENCGPTKEKDLKSLINYYIAEKL